ncbi:unnamed protein product, partial [Musa banksii]
MSTRRTLGDQLLLTKSSLAEACHLRVIIIDHVPFVLLPPPSTNHRWPLRALHPSTFGEIAHRERWQAGDVERAIPRPESWWRNLRRQREGAGWRWHRKAKGGAGGRGGGSDGDEEGRGGSRGEGG